MLHADQTVEYQFDWVTSGNYERIVNVIVEKGTCLMCHKNEAVLMTDSSEGEYVPAQLCFECIIGLFAEYERSNSHVPGS